MILVSCEGDDLGLSTAAHARRRDAGADGGDRGEPPAEIVGAAIADCEARLSTMSDPLMRASQRRETYEATLATLRRSRAPVAERRVQLARLRSELLSTLPAIRDATLAERALTGRGEGLEPTAGDAAAWAEPTTVDTQRILDEHESIVARLLATDPSATAPSVDEPDPDIARLTSEAVSRSMAEMTDPPGSHDHDWEPCHGR